MTVEQPETPRIAGYATTFHAMFNGQQGTTEPITSVSIPLIQRDYAQGRLDARTAVIRDTFLDALHSALTGGPAVGLDFIYGEVQDESFEPLDGQQRLTTLFLLHWYVAARRGALTQDQPWTRFSYATRPSARLFCQRLVTNPPPQEVASAPGTWISDQNWFLHLWQFDPTIQAMLVTLDAIADRFQGEDPERLWAALTSTTRPPIWFQLLPIEDMGSADELYIKMNSRGKPLTEFEAFKAFLGQLFEDVGGYEEFGHRIDGAWTDAFWPYRGDNDIVDDEIMRYVDFLLEVCAWREDSDLSSDLRPEVRARRLLSGQNPRHREHLDFVYAAFETWAAEPSASDLFVQTFTVHDGDHGVRLFGADVEANLFKACCARYGDLRGNNRVFSLTETLLLLAVIVHRTQETEDPEARLRVLRNVNEASQFEVRLANMSALVREVEAFMRTGDLDDLPTFNTNQVKEEAQKRALIAQHPGLRKPLTELEDHPVLRGTLAAFDLTPELAARAETFIRLVSDATFHELTGALLACGDYFKVGPNTDQFRFGSPTTEGVWRQILVDRGDRESMAPVRQALTALLDRSADDPRPPEQVLSSVARAFVDERADKSHFDWRYHLVRYGVMREGNTGIYYGSEGRLGYEMTMLRKKYQSGYYRDPFLYAMWKEAGEPPEITDPWFKGYASEPRFLELTRTGSGLRCVQAGLVVKPGAAHVDAVQSLLATDAVRTDVGWLVPVPQQAVADGVVDSVDRVQLGAELLTRLVSAGI